MTRLLRQLWADDGGGVLSAERILVMAVIVYGIIPGVVALRNSLIAALATTGNTLLTVTPRFTYSGYAIAGTNTLQPIAAIGGIGVAPSTVVYLSGTQVGPTNASDVVVRPAT